MRRQRCREGVRGADSAGRVHADELEAQGDFVGAATWRPIEDAIGRSTETVE